MEKIRQERPDLEVIVLNDSERASFEKASNSLHEIFYDVVANAYSDADKVQARKDAEVILQNIIKEVAELEKTL
jgi:hypothetical protein